VNTAGAPALAPGDELSGSEILATVRRAVRSVVEETPELRRYPDLERRIANRMVGVSLAAANLMAEEKRLSDEIGARAIAQGLDADPSPLAMAQTASDLHGQSAVRSAAGVLRATRDAIDFPNFVTSLITGVFQSIQTSNIQQLQAFSDLMEATSGTLDDFASTQITDGRALAWAAGRFPVFTTQGEGDAARLALRPDAEMPPDAELGRVLGASASEVRTIDSSDLNGTLLPIVRRKLARDRQSMLSTMILMGLQRVVVDDGHLHASMDLRVDARSIAEQTRGEQLDTRVETEASGSFGMGAWGASARLSASVGFVKSDEQYTREDIAVQAGLRSSVDVRFHTEPLDTQRVANERTLDRLRDRSLVPDAERSASRNLIETAPTRATERPRFPTPSAPGSLISREGGGTLEEARRARERGTGNASTADTSGGNASTADTSGGNAGTTDTSGGNAGTANPPPAGETSGGTRADAPPPPAP
jgi:hypothetical protein